MIRKILLVIACLLLHMFSAGISFSFGVLYREMRLEFGTSHSEAAWIASIFNGLLGFVGVPLGLIANKIGERWPTVCGSGLVALGMFTSMFATQISTVYVTYGILAGLGAGITHYCAYTVLAQNINDRWRPVAVTVSSAGLPLSALILPPIMTVLIEQFDWRKAYMVLACVSLVGVPSSLSFFPSKLTQNSHSQSESLSGQQSNRKLSRFLKDVKFMLYFVSSFAVFLVLFVPFTFVPDLMHESGRSSTDVYICVMTMGSGDLAARLLLGFLIQRIPTYLAMIHSTGAMILCFSTGLITFSRSFEAFVVMSGVIGVGAGCFSGLVFFMCTHLLPAEDLRVGYGIVLTFWGLALVAGMPLAGFVTDSFETERGAFIFASGMFFIAAVLELVLGLRDICERKSSMLYTITPEVNAVNIANEDLGIQRTVVGNEECSHI